MSKVTQPSTSKSTPKTKSKSPMKIPPGATLEEAAVNTLRVLSCEAIAAAKSGHSGIVLGAAPIMYAVYKNMNFDPSDGTWFNRDRFVMSAGHGSALLYSTLYCFGFDGIDLKTFRKLGSPLSGHPELDEKIGVDCSTGPLGQGIAMAVGIAAAEKKLAAEYNREGHTLIDHHTYCVVGDGCLMEGVSYEACNLAGLWKLNKLIVLYDCNEVTLDGTRVSADVEDVKQRFAAMKWNVLEVKNGNDENVIAARIRRAKAFTDAPTVIIVRTEIGFGGKNSGSHKAHGQVFTMEEVREMRKKWLLVDKEFGIDDDVAKHFSDIVIKKEGSAKKWDKKLAAYQKAHGKKYDELVQFITRPTQQFKCESEDKAMATRDAGNKMLEQIARQTPRLWGASADVASTTKAFINGGSVFSHKKPKGTDIACGVREFAMAALCNGAALHGYTPYCSTFLAFSDYCKAAIRLTALMDLPVTYIFTHDGIGNAPDGPTHQATEHIAALRLVPNFGVFRPADDIETAAVYEYAFERQKPACIILGRGSVPSPSGANAQYKTPQAVLLSAGAEVSLCAEAQKLLTRQGVAVNVLSAPCLKMLDGATFDTKVPVIAVEMGHGMPWWAFMGKWGLRGDVISFDLFGYSGKDTEVMEKLGFTAEKIADRVLELVKK